MARIFFKAAIFLSLLPNLVQAQDTSATRTGAAAFGDWRSDAPGVRRLITPADLPPPLATPSRSNGVSVVRRPADAQLKVPAGFTIKQFAVSGVSQPRTLRVAPNGDIFVVEMFAGRVRVLRPNASGDGAALNEVFASGLNYPFGVAFYPNGDNPQWVYVSNLDSVVRFPYLSGDTKARGRAETIVKSLPARGGHTTRDMAFSKDGSTMYISVGSGSNDGENIEKPDSLQKWVAEHPLGAAWGEEYERAAVLAFDPQGNKRRIFATGIRNCVGLAVDPAAGDLWCSTNERDLLGDDLVPDYLTRVRDGHFYGWPWYYIGSNEDPRHKGDRPDLKDKVTVPDILLQAHSASLGMAFYTGDQFPAAYKGSIFAAEHGSWNRSKRTGYKIIRGLIKDGKPTGEYEDFVTGFVVSDSSAWGRPVGITQMKDGSLLFCEDGNSTIWRVTYGERRSSAE
ncbi:MAG: PQQ-dependent sugar dehydrogenase [Xanthobacteraceae bacterium]